MESQFRLVLVALILLLLCACSGNSNGNLDIVTEPMPSPPPQVGVIGDGRLGVLADWARSAQGVPAMGIVLVANGQIAEMAAVGRRSVAATELVTVNDRWHIGSLTKSMTATLAATLIDQSVISWDTTPLDVWPELGTSMHPSFRSVTMRQLLSHTSGMRRADITPPEFDHRAPGSAMERRRRYAAALLAETPAGPVGRESYSNGGVIVAGAMMETLMSGSWESLMKQQVFAPLGMLDSDFGAPGTAGLVDQPLGHRDTGLRFEPVEPGPDADNPDTMGPAGTVHASLADYGQFMLAHIAGARGIGGLVTADTFEVLQTPVTGGSAPGWGVTSFKPWAQGRVLAYAGSNQRWYAVVQLAPDLDAGAMIVVNAGGGRANAAIDLLSDLVFERFEASQ